MKAQNTITRTKSIYVPQSYTFSNGIYRIHLEYKYGCWMIITYNSNIKLGETRFGWYKEAAIEIKRILNN